MTTSQATHTSVAANPHRWSALVFNSIAQLMISVDSTIVNIALPSAQQELGMSDSIRHRNARAYRLLRHSNEDKRQRDLTSLRHQPDGDYGRQFLR